MSVYGPIVSPRSAMNRRVMCLSSVLLNSFGLHATPPLAPPNGMSINAVFQVIHAASARTSSAVTSGWYRMPPLPGPRTRL